jgi:hypothetical protein
MALIAVNRRDLSLMDPLGFQVMPGRELGQAFAFDRHLEDAGIGLSTSSGSGAG